MESVVFSPGDQVSIYMFDKEDKCTMISAAESTHFPPKNLTFVWDDSDL